MEQSFIQELQDIVGEDQVLLDQKALKSGSKDCFHFSPVLIPILDDKQAEVIVRPETEAQLVELIKLCVAADVPITPRGGGTGNYGQGVPLHGGVLVNTRRMNQIVELKADSAKVEAGLSLLALEREAASVGSELRMFPSTIATSSAGGFVTGGSGGIGSIEWGMLSDEGNIPHMRIVTVEAEPQIIDLTDPEELSDVLHNCGLTAFVTQVTFALAPKTQWHQYVYAFDDFTDALKAGEAVAKDTDILKRLVTVFEWPIPSYFMPLVKREACPEGKALLFLMTDRSPDEMQNWIADRPCECSFHLPPHEGTGKGFQIYDFTWNHTTQWAMKADSNLTYLQDAYDPERLYEQLELRKQKYGNQIAAHIEFIKGQDGIRPGGLSIVDYRGKEQLWEIIQWCEDNGIRIANPHTHYLDEDSRWYGDNIIAAKHRWDPKLLLNPGHLKQLEMKNFASPVSK